MATVSRSARSACRRACGDGRRGRRESGHLAREDHRNTARQQRHSPANRRQVLRREQAPPSVADADLEPSDVPPSLMLDADVLRPCPRPFRRFHGDSACSPGAGGQRTGAPKPPAPAPATGRAAAARTIAARPAPPPVPARPRRRRARAQGRRIAATGRRAAPGGAPGPDHPSDRAAGSPSGCAGAAPPCRRSKTGARRGCSDASI